jgi:hypothetical protein
MMKRSVEIFFCPDLIGKVFTLTVVVLVLSLTGMGVWAGKNLSITVSCDDRVYYQEDSSDGDEPSVLD